MDFSAYTKMLFLILVDCAPDAKTAVAGQILTVIISQIQPKQQILLHSVLFQIIPFSSKHSNMQKCWSSMYKQSHQTHGKPFTSILQWPSHYLNMLTFTWLSLICTLALFYLYDSKVIICLSTWHLKHCLTHFCWNVQRFTDFLVITKGRKSE